LNTTTHIVTSLPKSSSAILMPYLMVLMMGGAVFLSKKQLRKATRKMKLGLLPDEEMMKAEKIVAAFNFRN
jgi:hypothetical protein